MPRLIRSIASAGFVSVVLGVGVSVVAATSASAMVNANVGETAQLSVSGSDLPSNTVFNLMLPTMAACSAPGSTDELVVSFLVPAATDLATLSYRSDLPLPDQGVALTYSNGETLQNVNAGNNPVGGINPQYAFGLALSGLIGPMAKD